MQELKSRPWVFKRRRQQRNIRRLLVALSALTVFNIGYGMARAEQDNGKAAFNRLTEPSELLSSPVGQNGEAVYSVEGSAVRFVFVRDGKDAKIRFLCSGGVTPCGTSYTLTGERAMGGDLLFRSGEGVPVLQLTAAGGGTVFGGADFVPAALPRTGAAILRD